MHFHGLVLLLPPGIGKFASLNRNERGQTEVCRQPVVKMRLEETPFKMALKIAQLVSVLSLSFQ